jgi:hypothetical protein
MILLQARHQRGHPSFGKVLLLAVPSRRLPHDLPELPSEVIAIRKTAAERNLGDAVTGGSQAGAAIRILTPREGKAPP